MAERPVILWVEDDPLHMMATDWLLDADFRLVTASTFVEARERILNEPRLDLAVLDVHVRLSKLGEFPPNEVDFALTKGGMEAGPALGRLILSQRPTLPFVGVSGLFNESVRVWFEKHGAGFLAKTDIRYPDAFLEYVRSRMRTSLITSIQAQSGATMVTGVDRAKGEKADQLRVRLRQLELEYTLAHAGLAKAAPAIIGVSVLALLVTGMGFAASMWGKREFLSGGNIVALSIVIALTVVVIAALVFGRSFKLRSQISKTKKELDILLGESMR